MSEQEQQDKTSQIRYEGGVPILDFRSQLSEVQRRQDEAERRDSQYKTDQIKLTRWLVGATVALAISTVAIGGIQAFYMHRQWKLTSGGLSKMGDQIWAAKDASFAATKAAETAASALAESSKQFRIEERPYVTVAILQASPTPNENASFAASVRLVNTGRSPALKMMIFIEGYVGSKKLKWDNPKGQSETFIGSGREIENVYTVNVNKQDADALNSGTESFIIKGIAPYTDIFQDVHYTTFCMYYYPKQNNYKYCHEGNEVR